MTSLHKQKDPAFVLPSYFWPSDELFTGMQRGEKKKIWRTVRERSEKKRNGGASKCSFYS